MDSAESQILIVIGSLLEAASDKDEKVRTNIYHSLKKLSQNNASSIITGIVNHRKRNSKLNNQELRYMVNLIGDICDKILQEADQKLIESVIEFALDESIKCSDVPYLPADLLTTVGRKYCPVIMNHLKKYMELGVVPHGSIVYIMGNLSMADVHNFYPFAEEYFQYLLSILNLIKTDSMKKICATCVSQFSECILEYSVTVEETSAKETFSPIVEEIFEMFITVWLPAKDNKTLEWSVRATSAMLPLLSEEKLTSDGGRTLHMLLSLYKRAPPALLPRFVVTVAVGNWLAAAPRTVILPVLDHVLHSLHGMVWITPDFAQPLTVKNHSEVLRCYDHIGSLFGDKLCDVMFRNLRSNSEQDKVVALIVMTHLLGSSEQIVKPRIVDLLNILTGILHESSVKINKYLAKMIVALAYREYVEEKEAVFIEFLVRHTYHDTTNTEIEDLESMCSSSLYVLSSAVVAVQHLCWNVLLQMLASNQHNQAVPIITKSLTYLITKCDLKVLERVCFVKSEAVFARVLCLLGSPLHRNRGVLLLNFLQPYIALKVNLDNDIWNTNMSKLISYLEESEWDETTWEYTLLDGVYDAFTSETQPWIEWTLAEFISLLLSYQRTAQEASMSSVRGDTIAADERAIAYKMSATLVRHLDENDERVVNVVDLLFSPIRHRIQSEFKTCSRAIAIVSQKHLNCVLDRLDSLVQSEMTKKTTKFLGLIKDSKGEADVELVRRTVCECKAQLLMEAPPAQLFPKLKTIAAWFVSQMHITKDVGTKQACIVALSNISELLVQHQDFPEKAEECRTMVLTNALNIIENTKGIPDVVLLNIIVTLFKLPATLTSAERLQILHKCFAKLFKYGDGCDEEANKMGVVKQLCILVEQTVDGKNGSIFEEVVQLLQPWLSHSKEYHRLASVQLLLITIRCFVRQSSIENAVKLTNVGALIGRVCIRAYEMNDELSIAATECVTLLFAMVHDEQPLEIQRLTDVCDMDAYIAEAVHKFTTTQIPFLMESLISGLLDAEETCSLGVARILLATFSDIGSRSHFQHQALDFFNSMLSNLTKISDESEVRKKCIQAILALARHHKKMFINSMLNQSLPLHSAFCDLWRTLPECEDFTDEVLEYLVETIKTNPLYEENVKQKNKRPTAALLPLTAISAIKEILESKNMNEFAFHHFAELFSTLLMIMTSYTSVSAPFNTSKIPGFMSATSTINVVPALVAFETLLTLIKRKKEEDEIDPSLMAFSSKMESGELFTADNDLYFDLIDLLARKSCRSELSCLAKVLANLSNYTGSNIEAQRVTVAAFCAKVLNFGCENDSVLIDTIVENLKIAFNDSLASVRRWGLKGFASIVDLNTHLIEGHVDCALSALLQGLDDEGSGSVHNTIILESLDGLSKLLSYLHEERYSACFYSILIRIRQFFDKEDVKLRSKCLQLVGQLVHHIPDRELLPFCDQVKNSLIPLLLHLAEEDPDVQKACKTSLKLICPMLNSDSLTSVTEFHLSSDNFEYCEFLSDASKVIATDFEDSNISFIITAMTYSKNNVSNIRAAAAKFIGIAYQETNIKWRKELSEKVSIDSICCRLLVLLKDSDPLVRANAANSLGLIF